MSKRIALISEHASPLATLGGVDCGGQNVYVSELALALADRGHIVDVFTRRDDPTLLPLLRWAPRVRIVHVDAGPPATVRKEELLEHMPAFGAQLVHFVSSTSAKYDIAHANFFMSGVVAEALEDATGTPFVITFHALGRVRRLHQGEADAFPDERCVIEERLVGRAAAVIAECPQDALDLRAFYGAESDRLRIVPCGVDLERFHPVPRERARRALGLDPDAPMLVQIGRMVPRKGVDDVIRAVGRLHRDHRLEARLLVIGGDEAGVEGPCAPELRRLRAVAEEEGVRNAVTFVGRRGGDVLRYYYSAADVFVTAPWYEPFGITPLESMACGTPVIGSAVGGVKFSVVNGETGLLVPPHDPDAIATAADRLLRDEPLRSRMSRNAVARVRERFRWQDVAAEIDSVYDDVLAPGHAPAERVVLNAPLALETAAAPPVRLSRGVPTELEA
jgi:glycosyltransferase involved in cell wall biosynthesis